MEDNKKTSPREKRKKLLVRIMAWIMSILMAGSVAGLTITMIVDMISHGH